MNSLIKSTRVAGALEIKLAYRKNLLRGILLASFGIFGAAFVFGFAIDDKANRETRPPLDGSHQRDSLYIMPPPPNNFEIPKRIPPRPDLQIEPLKQPEFGEIKPVEDGKKCFPSSADLNLKVEVKMAVSMSSGGLSPAIWSMDSAV